MLVPTFSRDCPMLGKVSLWQKLFELRRLIVGAIPLCVGVILISTSLFLGRGSRAADYLKEAGFMFAATGIAFLVAEHTLRRESILLLTRTIKTTIHRNLGDVRSSVTVLASIVADLKRVQKAVANSAVKEVLQARLGSGDACDLRIQKGLSDMVDNFHRVGGTEHWAKEVYRQYLADVIENTSENTMALCELTAIPASSRQINLVSRAQRTDEILEKLMAKMDEDSKFSVVSDVESWLNDQLGRFFRQSKAAADRGVLIRRIFVWRDEDIIHGAFTPAQGYRELLRHLEVQSSTEGRGYHIRLYHPAMMLDLNKDRLELLKEHFGIFTPAKHNPCIHVKVEKTNLSLLNLTNLPLTSATHDDFDVVWNALKQDVTKDVLESTRDRWIEIAKISALQEAAAAGV